MTPEQKPESAEFRTREEHALALRHIIDETRVPDRLPVALAHVRAAEARGAAEQRRKDAEGDNPVGYRMSPMEKGCCTGRWASETWLIQAAPPPAIPGVRIEPLYTQSANVAVLKARVKELEGVNKAWSIAAANAMIWLENGRQANARDELKAAQRRAAAIREGGEHE